MKRTTRNNLKALGLIAFGIYLVALAMFNIANAWFSDQLYYEFFTDGFARFSKYNLAFVMIGIGAIGYLLAATGVLYYWKKFKKTNVYQRIKLR